MHRSRRYSTKRDGAVVQRKSQQRRPHPHKQTTCDAVCNAKARAVLLRRLAGGSVDGGPPAGGAPGFHSGPERE